MTGRAWWVASVVAVVVTSVVLIRRAPRRPVDAVPPVGARATDAARRTRQLLAENLALRREAAVLRSVLAAVPVVRGLPAPSLQLTSADEKRMLDEIGQRVGDGVRPRAEQLYRELQGTKPPPGMRFETLMAALLDAAGIKDHQGLFAELAAHRKIYQPNGSPPPDASTAQRVLWLLDDADGTLERELAEALPPDRFEQLQRSPLSGVGFVVQQRKGHWVVKQSPAL
jgi:hypothetical protein